MNQSCTPLAHRRLATVALLAGIGWTFACRPAWSPDSRQVVYPALVGERRVLCRYDLDRGTNEVLFEPSVADKPAIAHYLTDGAGVLVLSSSAKEGGGVAIEVLPLDGDGEPRHLDVDIDEDGPFAGLPPVVVGNELFLGGKRLHRIDLTTGATTAAPPDERLFELVLAPRGDGICYIARTDEDDGTRWEVGTVDPTTLATEPLFASPRDEGWRILPMPVFTRDLTRVALPGLRPKGHTPGNAILVFSEGKLETTLPIPGDERAGLGSLCWGPDEVTIYAISLRPVDYGTGCFLRETTFSGSVVRETMLFDGLPEAKASPLMGMMFQLAVSPDGSMAAMSTAAISDYDIDQHGLMLVELKAKERTVTRVPFPQR